MSKDIVIVDYGCGNIGAIKNMIEHVGYEVLVTRKCSDVRNASKVILPGVGAFDRAMSSLKSLSLDDAVKDVASSSGQYLLGICLGMQLFAQSSEEGELPGLGVLPVSVKRFASEMNADLKVPHMGWNSVSVESESILWKSLLPASRFYFAHSYHLSSCDSSLIALGCHYGHVFPAAVQKDKIIGVQFHPEKSHKYGMAFFEAFLALK